MSIFMVWRGVCGEYLYSDDSCVEDGDECLYCDECCVEDGDECLYSDECCVEDGG